MKPTPEPSTQEVLPSRGERSLAAANASPAILHS
jgi:hypothetical protein